MNLAILVVFFIIFYANYYLGKRLVKGRYEDVSETEGKNIDRLGSVIIVSIFILLGIMLDIHNTDVMKWLLVFFFTSMFSFQAFMEWKYLGGTKHIASIVLMAFSVIAILSVFHLDTLLIDSTSGEYPSTPSYVEFFLRYIDYELFSILIFILMILWSIFLIVKIKSLVIVMVVITVIFLFVNHMQYTTFPKLVSDQLNEEAVIKELTLNINEYPDGLRERVASVTIEDEEIVASILKDLQPLKLKRDVSRTFKEFNYDISILVTNQTDKGDYLTNHLYLGIAENYVNGYLILNQTNHLKTIKSLLENEEVEWIYYDEKN
ncbi:hypothetical protein BKP35_00840 [Anaerobacillus arseniciselenatis]|uniref:Uncharacterized protein n=1 Tax=Anaerobacillus arseniciselenatis TaxID=85682 RepID=A0A1S2LTC0_9BACI|nr:DUF4181 domain-containing protein [Anaerobacillus arseniciselenatis]OIJ15574.1 hypothetical protein BKP35_00840 [Anaerobacillus arseniciselenatis]